MNKYKIACVGLGCGKNQFDLEAALADIITNGHEIVSNFKDADIIIINTCAFIEAARREAQEIIEKALKEKKKRKRLQIVVTGCYPQTFKEELEELYGRNISAYCGIEMHKYIMKVINHLVYHKDYIEKPGTEWFEPINGRLNTIGQYEANLKISEGCKNRCAYCAIPNIRGPLRSRPMEYILDEAQKLSDMGVVELNLIAQDITDYGKDLKIEDGLTELLYKLNEIKGSLKWIRLMYAYPTEITDNLIKTIKDCDKVVKYLDIPLQHGDNQVLKDMNRRGSREEYLDLIQKLRESIPEICLRSTFIVGYPTETEKAFENLCDFIEKAQFDRAGLFTYSKEINTPAYKLLTEIPNEIKEERANIVYEILDRISLEKNKQLISKDIDVLCLERDDGYIYGRTYRDAMDIDGIIKIPTNKDLVGQIIKAKVTNCDVYDLEGILI